MDISLERLLKAMTEKKYPVYKNGEYNLNLVGIRSKDQSANLFNDVLCALYWMNGKPVLHQFPITTDPGTYYRENPINVQGTAILAPGHYKRCWQLGYHQGKYPALVQRGIMRVYRDANRNNVIDLKPESMEQGYFGINLHRRERESNSDTVDKWSAGCQVFRYAVDFNLVMALANKAAQTFGPNFSYTLFDESDLTT